MKILIVDDDSLILEMLRVTLEEQGHEVTTADDGEAALALVTRSECQVVISDWNMPKLNGVELCRAIRSRDADGYVYILLLTARDSMQSRHEGFAAGADDFITKPFEPEDLLCRLRVAERMLALESRDLTIFAMAKLAEARDTDTGKHIERVQSYALALTKNLYERGIFADQIDSSFVKLIYETSPLHDIGKVAIPDCILLKPGRLCDEEFAIMKQHTTLGAQTLEAAAAKRPGARFLRVAAEIAASHHERWDGRGYPRGLRAEEIPLAARIVALADVYDAITSKRIYKPACTHMTARAEIVTSRGTQFDPVVVDAFIIVEREFLSIRERHSDLTKAAA